MGKKAKETQYMKDIYEQLRHCPYCKLPHIQFLYSASDLLTNKPGMFYLSQCKECSLVFQNPRVKEQYIHQFYTYEPDYYQLPRRENKKFNLRKRALQYVINQVLANHFHYAHLGKKNLFFKIVTLPLKRHLKIKSMPNFVEEGSLLEIGCSQGHVLEKLKRYGWDTYGIEMGKKLAHYAKKVRGLKVENKKIEEVSYNKNSFDIIIMTMVLEHLYHPFHQLAIITQWLKPGGQLIFSLPYFDGLEFKFFKQYAYGLQLPTHITFFNKKILKEYLMKLGYKNIKFYFQYTDKDITASAHYKYLATHQWIYKFISDNKMLRWMLIKPLIFLLSLLKKTSRVIVFTEKK